MALPETEADVAELVRFAAAHGLFFAPDFTTFFGEIDVYAE